MLRALFRLGIKLYPHAFRREYGALIMSCYDDKIASQPNAKAQRLVAMRELTRLPSSILSERSQHTSQTRKHSIVSIVIAALILSAGYIVLLRLTAHNPILSSGIIIQKVLVTTISGVIAAVWLGFSYSAFHDRPYRYLVASIATVLATSKVGIGLVQLQFYVSQLFGYQLIDVHGHWSPLVTGPTWYVIVWLYYTLLLTGIFMIAHAIKFGIIKLNLRVS